MDKALIATVVFVLTLCAAGSETSREPASPFVAEAAFVCVNGIDECVLAKLRAEKIEPASLCSDAVFCRRVHLDVIGALPTPEAVESFLKDMRQDKRSRLIDDLLGRDRFADYWSLKWCDLLRVKAEFPINLWPNAVQAYYRWIRESIAKNKPYDAFVRELLTSSGSNFREPPVNFYRAIQGRSPAAMARAAALTFMGVRLGRQPEDRRRELEAFFSRVAFKKTAEWKEEIVFVDPSPWPAFEATTPDGKKVKIAAGEDPRRVFADWLIDEDNAWFSRNIANRVWSWFFGRGIIHEPDDIRPDNPATNPELLAFLERELIKADYDLKHLYRLILNSRTYQQSSIPNGDDPKSAALFACYPVRRLEAEVLIDALCWICGDGESYVSQIPEPFTYIPERHPTITLADGSITSQFLEMFGRPSRDTGLESERNNRVTDAQRLHLLNSTHVQRKIERSGRLRRLLQTTRRDEAALIRAIYINVLSRYPTREEMEIAQAYIGRRGVNRWNGAADLAWALINTKEFLFRH